MALPKELSNVLSFVISKGYQIHPDAFDILKNHDKDVMKIISRVLKNKEGQNRLKRSNMILAEDLADISTKLNEYVSPNKIDKNNVNDLMASFSEIENEQSYFRILFDPSKKIRSYNNQYSQIGNDNNGSETFGFINLFKSRYEKLSSILANRQESKNITKISFIKNNIVNLKKNSSRSMFENNNLNSRRYDKNSSFFISGLVMSKNSKKNGLEIIIDDQSGIINTVAVSDDVKRQVAMIALDQMVLIEVENNGSSFIIKKILSPDIPDHIAVRSKKEEYVVLISDLHVGSRYFMEEQFLKFIEWLSSPNNEIASKIKFLCLCGDLIDGVGIFPNQEKELLELDAIKQMNHAINLLTRIPEKINVFIIPGNHDLGRRALPQPSIPKKYSQKLYDFKNISMLGNPCLLDLNGVKTLMFHGQSLDDIIATTPGLSYSHPAEAMKILLKARHLSPIYGQRTPLSPENEDMMVIDQIPDILHSGHVHVIDVQNYKGTLMVNSGAWQAQTKFQQTMGITPTPGIAIVVNLATLQPFQVDFNDIY